MQLSVGLNVRAVHSSHRRAASSKLLCSQNSKLVVPGPDRQYLSKSHPFPDPEEEREVNHDAFMQAVQQSKPAVRIPGLQEFAAAVWERRRRIPSTTYNDPLRHIFMEFDADNDGHLTAAEVVKALQSRNVEITEEQVQEFINEVDANSNGTVELEEWGHLVFHMASVDLHRPTKDSQDVGPMQDD